MADWNPRANEIYLAAVELSSSDHRTALLDKLCGGDSQLRAYVGALLTANDTAESFLQHPAIADAEFFQNGDRRCARSESERSPRSAVCAGTVIRIMTGAGVDRVNMSDRNFPSKPARQCATQLLQVHFYVC